MTFNKLVRDKIPEIIEASGTLAKTRILSEEEYLQALAHKLNEEVGEYHRDQNLEELADILEVIYALANAQGYSTQQLLDVYNHKHEARGGFADRIFLISTDARE